MTVCDYADFPQHPDIRTRPVGDPIHPAHLCAAVNAAIVLGRGRAGSVYNGFNDAAAVLAS